MNVTENINAISARPTRLDDRNYITIGLTYDEFLDLQSLLDTIKNHYSKKSEEGSLWCEDKFSVILPRDARMLVNLSKKLEKIY